MNRLALLALLPMIASLAIGANAPLPVDGLPIVQDWVPAEVPASHASGLVKVRAVVDAMGHVDSAHAIDPGDPVLAAAAEKAVKAWTFSPGLEDSKPVTKCIDVPFDFSVPQAKPTLSSPKNLQIRASPRTSAQLVAAPLGEFPPSLLGRGLPGAVYFSCNVTREGRMTNLRVLEASHVDFVAAALATSPQWKFRAAQQGDVPVGAELRGQVFFDEPKLSPAAALAANGITAPDGTAPENRPVPIAIADPVYPYDALLKSEGGTASVEFTVTASGLVTDVRVRDATQPSFGRALAASMESWQFTPALVQGRGVDVKLDRRFEFKPIAEEADEKSDPLARLVVLARKNAIGGAAGLDEKLAALYRVPPPQSSTGTGQAVIEFVIDREGRVRLPNIVLASNEELGWAAVTAVAQWVFKAPLREGKPTDVKVKVPFEF